MIEQIKDLDNYNTCKSAEAELERIYYSIKAFDAGVACDTFMSEYERRELIEPMLETLKALKGKYSKFAKEQIV
ncbi:MAG: hypothetical protein BA874_00640 [Desulfuromonadales bacterium C00003068]|jgi:hypothetical protein|nr:MAG: hypothetical protein BA874_00640 [Desulfuromonadales bacterium C00003068]